VVRISFSGREIASILRGHCFRPVRRTGSHLKLRYRHPETDQIRVVPVPMGPADDIPTGTLQSIACQCGAEDFHARCEWIDANR